MESSKADDKTSLLRSDSVNYSVTLSQSYKEEDAQKSVPSIWSSKKGASILCILFTELCERLTYYSIAANLVIYCTNQMNYDSPTALKISLIFTGTSYFFPVFGGWIADAIAGKFNTIYGSALIYLLGTAILPVISMDFDKPMSDGWHRFFFLLGLFLIGLGTGGIKSNVGPFGAQQLEDLGDAAVQSFFNWFYWFINIGAGIAFSLVVYVQQEVGFGWGYFIPAASMFLAVILFLAPRKVYITTPPEGSVMAEFVKITSVGACSCLRKRSTRATHIENCVDYAKESQGGNYPDVTVDMVKSVYRILPIFTTIIIYWTIYFQMSSSCVLQGERLNLYLGTFMVPVAALTLFNSIIILIMIPVMDRVVYRFLERVGLPLSQLKRIGIGMILAALAMILAAGVEFARKENMRQGHFKEQIVADKPFNASDLSVAIQIPQYCLIGASEIFTSISGLEFAYSQSPVVLQGVVMGLFLLTSGLGSYLGSLLITIVNAISGASGAKWLPDEINDGYLEYFYILLAVLMMINFFVYLVIAKRYKYVQQSQINESVSYSTTTNQRDTSSVGTRETARDEGPPPEESRYYDNSESEM